MAIDPQVQIKLIDLAWKKAFDLRTGSETIDQYLDSFKKIYEALLKTVS